LYIAPYYTYIHLFSPIKMRETIFVKDVQRFYGCCKRTAINKRTHVRKVLNKPPRSPITAKEFAQVHNLDYEQLLEYINKKHKSLV